MSDMEYTRAVLVPLTDTGGWSRGRILEAVTAYSWYNGVDEPTDLPDWEEP